MRRSLFLAILLLVAIAAWSPPACAERMGLSNLVVDNQEGRVKVRFGVDIKAVEAVKEALRNGEVLALQCRAVLSRKSDYLWNAKVASAETISRLVLLEDGSYEIIHPGGRRENFRGRDLALTMQEAWGSMSLDLGPWSLLSRGNVYSLSLDIRLVRQDVASWLKNTLFFWSFDAISPVEYQLDFSY